MNKFWTSTAWTGKQTEDLIWNIFRNYVYIVTNYVYIVTITMIPIHQYMAHMFQMKALALREIQKSIERTYIIKILICLYPDFCETNHQKYKLWICDILVEDRILTWNLYYFIQLIRLREMFFLSIIFYFLC